MFFSCCDWEDAREAEVQKDSDSDDDENQLPLKICKRKAKLARKSGLQLDDDTLSLSQLSESSIDIDAVIKKVADSNDTERIVSSKKYIVKAPRATKLAQKKDSSEGCLSPICFNNERDLSNEFSEAL